jgi:hypothetical protein
LPAQTTLTPAQVAQILNAQRSATKVRRAAGVARFDGWMIATFAALTILTGFTSASALLLGVGMFAVATIEFRGADRLRRLEPTAAKTLALNQLGLGAMLIAYSAWQLYLTHTTPSSFAAAAGAGSDPQLAHMMGSLDQLATTLTSAVYVLLICIAIFIQGGTALYYFSRQRHLDDHVNRTPKWVTDLQRAGVAV